MSSCITITTEQHYQVDGERNLGAKGERCVEYWPSLEEPLSRGLDSQTYLMKTVKNQTGNDCVHDRECSGCTPRHAQIMQHHGNCSLNVIHEVVIKSVISWLFQVTKRCNLKLLLYIRYILPAHCFCCDFPVTCIYTRTQNQEN